MTYANVHKNWLYTYSVKSVLLFTWQNEINFVFTVSFHNIDFCAVWAQ